MTVDTGVDLGKAGWPDWAVKDDRIEVKQCAGDDIILQITRGCQSNSAGGHLLIIASHVSSGVLHRLASSLAVGAYRDTGGDIDRRTIPNSACRRIGFASIALPVPDLLSFAVHESSVFTTPRSILDLCRLSSAASASNSSMASFRSSFNSDLFRVSPHIIVAESPAAATPLSVRAVRSSKLYVLKDGDMDWSSESLLGGGAADTDDATRAVTEAEKATIWATIEANGGSEGRLQTLRESTSRFVHPDTLDRLRRSCLWSLFGMARFFAGQVNFRVPVSFSFFFFFVLWSAFRFPVSFFCVLFWGRFSSFCVLFFPSLSLPLTQRCYHPQIMNFVALSSVQTQDYDVLSYECVMKPIFWRELVLSVLDRFRPPPPPPPPSAEPAASTIAGRVKSRRRICGATVTALSGPALTAHSEELDSHDVLDSDDECGSDEDDSKRGIIQARQVLDSELFRVAFKTVLDMFPATVDPERIQRFFGLIPQTLRREMSHHVGVQMLGAYKNHSSTRVGGALFNHILSTIHDLLEAAKVRVPPLPSTP